MSSLLTKESIKKIYDGHENIFIKNAISELECVAVSRTPIELGGVRFRISLFFDGENFDRVSLVAVSNQIQQEYIGVDTRVIHEKWLKKWEGTPHKTVLYGVQYYYSNMNISTEHDPRSGSDVIIINYREAQKKGDIIETSIINNSIQKDILQGLKVPHSTSQPVIYKQDGKYYLAAFVFFYTKEDIESGTVDRPTLWALADIETGEIVKEYETKEKDFSSASYAVKYNVRTDGEYDTSKEYYDKAFTILDSVRSKIIKDGKFYKGEYQYYLNMILANIPKEYQRFYTDLSV